MIFIKHERLDLLFIFNMWQVKSTRMYGNFIVNLKGNTKLLVWPHVTPIHSLLGVKLDSSRFR